VTVAVAVVSWNTRELLRGSLESLRPDADAGLAEVWVVDNASSDGSAEMVRSDFGWTRLLPLDENVGFGAAVNRVATQTGAAWIAPANADVAVEPGALRALVEAGERDAAAGAVAPRLILPDGATQHSP
jgi:N-acetylglucosaminyl-diphospho-decaprenol L-rhamnosyltransferase